jgi:hypothetical protein
MLRLIILHGLIGRHTPRSVSLGHRGHLNVVSSMPLCQDLMEDSKISPFENCTDDGGNTEFFRIFPRIFENSRPSFTFKRFILEVCRSIIYVGIIEYFKNGFASRLFSTKSIMIRSGRVAPCKSHATPDPGPSDENGRLPKYRDPAKVATEWQHGLEGMSETVTNQKSRRLLPSSGVITVMRLLLISLSSVGCESAVSVTRLQRRFNDDAPMTTRHRLLISRRPCNLDAPHTLHVRLRGSILALLLS